MTGVKNRKLKIDDVKRIPELLDKGLNYDEIGKELKVTRRTVVYWIRRLKLAGVKLSVTRGPKPFKIN